VACAKKRRPKEGKEGLDSRSNSACSCSSYLLSNRRIHSVASSDNIPADNNPSNNNSIVLIFSLSHLFLFFPVTVAKDIAIIATECIFFQTFFLGLLQEDQKLEHNGGSSSQAAKLSLDVLYGYFSRYHLHYYYGVLVTCRQLQVHWRLQTSLVKKYVCSAPAL
jgi:hypothetical protein